MNVHRFNGPPPEWLGAALERFESQFHYPLGPDRSFRVAHGRDYAPFFQAMGEAHLFAAERDGVVLGTLGAVLRPLRFPGGQIRPAVYLCDLKVAAEARRSRALPYLMRAAREALEIPSGGRGFGVVMDGTPSTPDRYTGALGIPTFEVLGRLAVLRLPVPANPLRASPIDICAPARVEELHQQFTQDWYVPLEGRPGARSCMDPAGLILLDGNACGVMEDTRRCLLRFLWRRWRR